MKYSYRNNIEYTIYVLSMRADNIRPYEFVTFTKFVLTYNLYCYLRANTVHPYD